MGFLALALSGPRGPAGTFSGPSRAPASVGLRELSRVPSGSLGWRSSDVGEEMARTSRKMRETEKTMSSAGPSIQHVRFKCEPPLVRYSHWAVMIHSINYHVHGHFVAFYHSFFFYL